MIRYAPISSSRKTLLHVVSWLAGCLIIHHFRIHEVNTVQYLRNNAGKRGASVNTMGRTGYFSFMAFHHSFSRLFMLNLWWTKWHL